MSSFISGVVNFQCILNSKIDSVGSSHMVSFSFIRTDVPNLLFISAFTIDISEEELLVCLVSRLAFTVGFPGE
jgi:hypothetical protein